MTLVTKHKKKDTIYFIIPAYNEGKALGEVIRNIPSKYKVICVDDGSGDDTAEVVRNSGAFLIKHPINMGQGAALQTGFDFALQDPNMKYVVTFDADGQHRLEDVEYMLEKIKESKADIIMGSRFLGETINMTPMKKAILKLAIRFSNATSGIKLTDTHNGLRVLNRHAVASMKLKMPDFAHASEIVDRIKQRHLKYKEVPVTIVYTDYSRSKGQSMINAINIAFDVIINKLVGI